MSYPFQGAPSNHPYPPNMSYPPNPEAPRVSYPPYPQPTYPPYPPTQVPYPPSQNNFSPYPGQMYPNQPVPSPTLYPLQPQAPSYSSGPFQAYPGGPSSNYPGGNPGGSTYPNLHPSNGPQSTYPLGVGSPHHSSGHHLPKANPTIRPANPFNPRGDAEVLRKAMKGLGTDEAAIIAVLSKRTNAQRQEIAKEFKTLYGKDLLKDLKSETSGKFEQLIVALMTPIHEFYAEEVHHAISGVGTNESTLIEVLCTLSNSELHYVKQAYEKKYGTSMETDLGADTSGNFKRLLVSLCMGRRDENNYIDPAAAESDAQALLRAGELRFGTDESTFNAILCSRSFPQLKAIFQAYERLTGHPFEKAVKKEFSGDIEEGLLAIVKCVHNKAGYLAECLQKCMAGAGTNDRALIRLLVTRSEIDLEDIKLQFQSIYGKSLESYIKGDTSGDYKKLLIALLG